MGRKRKEPPTESEKQSSQGKKRKTNTSKTSKAKTSSSVSEQIGVLQETVQPSCSFKQRKFSINLMDVSSNNGVNENVDPNLQHHNSSNKKPTKNIGFGSNVINYFENMQRGRNPTNSRCLKDIIIGNIKKFKVYYKAQMNFDRRTTFIEWHPSNPKVLAVSSKGGDITLWNYEDDVELATVKGIGAGGSIQAMKFHPLDPVQIYTVSIEGKFLLLNFETKNVIQFLDTGDFKKWYVSFDINVDSKIMVAGNNLGTLTLLTLEGEKQCDIRCSRNKQKITHCEFSKNEPWLLCTSSNEGSVKLWDIRNIKEDNKNIAIPLKVLSQEKPINAAYFSLTNGNRLLTTDQKDLITVYRWPNWEVETEIIHPHRQFQYLTPIRAYWHPLEDIIVVGRYPVDQEGHESPRTIDFFDADDGRLLHEHSHPGFNGVFTLNRFNHLGDALASATGNRIMIWRPDYKGDERSDFRYYNSKPPGSDLDEEDRFPKDDKDDDSGMKKFPKNKKKPDDKKKGSSKVKTKVT